MSNKEKNRENMAICAKQSSFAGRTKEKEKGLDYHKFSVLLLSSPHLFFHRCKHKWSHAENFN